MNKPLTGMIGTGALTLVGIILKWNAHDLAWPRQGSWSGPASETVWGRQEVAIGQIGLALMFAGILVFVVTYAYWLFDKKPDK